MGMATQSLTVCIPHIEVFAAARGAASGIFQLIDKIPKIDSSAKTEISPLSILGGITLENINFSYPSRPDMKVKCNIILKFNNTINMCLKKCNVNTIMLNTFLLHLKLKVFFNEILTPSYCSNIY